MLKKLFGLALALLATLAVSAQVRVGEGQLSGSFERVPMEALIDTASYYLGLENFSMRQVLESRIME